ncbi:ribosome maturation factor RimP [[Eubacterium] hominis]|uniref:ribosome maturation factor RimP n=1 Tax=[Eubacterium] hominis TaxID=2764325 RepID=UPI003A4D44B0
MDQIQRIKELVMPILEKEEIQLYEVLWHSEGKNRILQISIMRNDGSMDIDTCADMSEKISTCLDEADLITSEYFLEVCSPGAERELKDEVQIQKAIGEFVYIKLKNPKAGLDEVKGYLKAMEDHAVLIEYMDKAVKKKVSIELDNLALIRLSVKI